jgi:hypothetical protein
LIEVCRIVESQSRLYAEQATSSYEKALYLESILEETKPKLPAEGWHPLIATPFRYPLPVSPSYQARFRPPFFSKNVLYASRDLRTILYEHAYHFLRERVHLKAIRESGQRTAFTLFISSTHITDLHKHPDIRRIMDRRDYAPSHAYIQEHPEAEVLLYPSCRDPQAGDNYAVLDVLSLAKHIGSQETISYYFEPDQPSIVWMDYGLRIAWKQVY